MKKFILIIILLSVFTFNIYTEDISSIEYISDTDSNEIIKVQNIDGKNYLFLPSYSDINEIKLNFKSDSIVIYHNEDNSFYKEIKLGETFNLNKFAVRSNYIYKIRIKFKNNGQLSNFYNLNILQSDNISSMFLHSKDKNKNRIWVDSSKKNKAKGEITFINEDGNLIYKGKLKQIKSRGNSTWGYPKKPYQIKLDEKFDLIETNIKDEDNKTWILLANYADPTLIRNTVCFEIARLMDIPYTPNFKHVDLYYDGEYRGNYLLIEKTQVKKGRVNIHDLEEDFEDVNKDIDLDKQISVISKNKLGNKIKYVKGINTPEDYSGGYLLEFDYQVRADREPSYFVSSNGQYIVTKSPEFSSKKAIEYISELYQNFEDAVFNKGMSKDGDKFFTEYMDLESLIKSYIHLEYTMNFDGLFSSTFFFKPKDEYKLYAGPVWDCDLTFNSQNEKLDENAFITARKKIATKLINIPLFKSKLKEYYTNDFCDIIENNILTDDPNCKTSFSYYKDLIMDSQAMDKIIWKTYDYNKSIEKLETSMIKRHDFLKTEISSWDDKKLSFSGYYDVDVNDWFYEYVLFVSDENLFHGNGFSMFMPSKNINNYQTAIILNRLYNNISETEIILGENSEFDNAINFLYENNIFDKDSFSKNEKTSRIEFIEDLYKLNLLITDNEDYNNYDDLSKYTDITDITDSQKEALLWAIKNNIITGKDNNKIAPDDFVKRYEVAVILTRILNNIYNK